MEALKKEIKSSLKEAEIYHGQGLLEEARDRYQYIQELIQEKRIKNSSLLATVKKKIQTLEVEIRELAEAPDTIEMSAAVQEIIRHYLAPVDEAEDDTQKTFMGAVYLARFGQFQRALAEFESLMKVGPMRLAAAKNMLRCYRALSEWETAVHQYSQWLEADLFTQSQAEKLHDFLATMMKKEGLEPDIPPPLQDAELELPDFATDQVADEGIIDISSVGIHLEKGPRAGQIVEYEVSFQAGEMLSLLIPARDKEVLEGLEADAEMRRLQFYSPIAMFNGRARVITVSPIDSGPKSGDFNMDIRIEIT